MDALFPRRLAGIHGSPIQRPSNETAGASSAKAQGWPELAVPRKILRLESLPLLGTGKVDYVSLKKLAEGA